MIGACVAALLLVGVVLLWRIARARRPAGKDALTDKAQGPSPDRASATQPEVSPWQQKIAAAAREAGTDPRSFWYYENSAARALVTGMLCEVASLLGSQPVIQEKPEKTALVLQTTYAGAPFRLSVDVQLGSLRDIDMQCDNRLGGFMVHREMGAVPRPVDPNDPWASEDEDRVFLAKGVFIEGKRDSLSRKMTAWRNVPAERQKAILAEMDTLDLLWVAATPAGNALGTPPHVALAGRANVQKMDDPISTLVSYAKLLELLKNAVSQPASAPGAATGIQGAVPRAPPTVSTPTAAPRPKASAVRIAAATASFQSLSSHPSDFWAYSNPAARERVHGLLLEVASLLGSEPVVQDMPDKKAVELHGTYAGAFFRFGVDVQFAHLQDIQMKCGNRIGTLMVCRDMDTIPKPVDPNDPWDKVDNPQLRRLYLAKGVFVEGRNEVAEQVAVWRSIPAEAQAMILGEMERLDLRYVALAETSVEVFGGFPDIREVNPVPLLISYAELLELLKNVAQGEYGSIAVAPPAAGPVERIVCKYCRSIFLLALGKTTCPNCGANATA